MTQDPACASVRPRDAIFAFVLAAVLEHVLHELLHTFAIPGVHDLEQSVKLHWLRIREAEQLSPFLRYPKFVARDVPKPQTEVRRVGREVSARFAFPQRLLGTPAFGHAGGKCHRSNGDDSRPVLQSKKRLVFRFLGEWPETMQGAPNRDRSATERDWIILGRNCKPSAEDRFAEDEQQQ